MEVIPGVCCRLQSILATHGIQTQTQKEVEPIKIKAPGDVLMKVGGCKYICNILTLYAISYL